MKENQVKKLVMAAMCVALGIVLPMAFHTIQNAGITLPFVSYGGTSVVFLLLEMGLVLSVSSLVK